MYAAMKMVKIADSAMIREIMPTLPREGSVQDAALDSITAGWVLMNACNGKSWSYSYLQSGSSGGLMSHSGRRLSTLGIRARLYSRRSTAGKWNEPASNRAKGYS